MNSTPVRISRRVTAVLVGAAFALIAGVVPAAGHTGVASSSPASGAVLQRLPAQMTLTFGDTIGRVGTMTLSRNGSGNLVKAARFDPRNPHRAIITITRLAPKKQTGRFRLTWRVLGPDGHPMQGVIPFRVRR